MSLYGSDGILLVIAAIVRSTNHCLQLGSVLSAISARSPLLDCECVDAVPPAYLPASAPPTFPENVPTHPGSS